MSIATASVTPKEGEREYVEMVQEALSAKSRALGRAMSYKDFTYEEVKDRFGLKIHQPWHHFAQIPPRPISALLRETLEENLPVGLNMGTESGRKEFIVAPVLMEVRRQMNRGIGVFSGYPLFVDEDQGLAGYPDFLLARSPQQLGLQGPVLVVVEAKLDDFKGGLPQCLAAMIGAQLFNRRAGNELQSIYGTVTNGSNWQFLSLTGQDVTIDLTEYYINEVERIVGIMVHMLS